MVEVPRGPASLVQKKEEPATTGKLTSTIQLARPFLTKSQIKHAQERTIESSTVYEQRRNQIFNFLMKICVSLKL